MFTGIIECKGKIIAIENVGTNYDFVFESEVSDQFRVDESIAHNGVCLTITGIEGKNHHVTAILETLEKSNLGDLKVGDEVNIERAMMASSRLDGHIVQGHVDQVGTCTRVIEEEGSWYFDFEYDASVGNITVEKGSICVNGVSLTCFKSEPGKFTVAIIPHTFEKTTFSSIKEGTRVNLEFDIIGKYVQRLSKAYN